MSDVTKKDVGAFILFTILMFGAGYASRVAGYNQGFADGQKQMMDEAVQWCAEAIVKICPNANPNKLQSKRKGGSTDT